MTLSRAILALLLVIIGGMVTVLHADVEGLSVRVTGLAERVDSKNVILGDKGPPSEPRFRTLRPSDLGTMRIGKPRVPAVRHIYKKVPTVIDRICDHEKQS